MSFERDILSHFDQLKISYKLIEHSETRTTKESAEARGRKENIGGKTLLMKSKHGFHLFSLPAHLEAENKRMRKIVRSQKLRFASADELMDLFGVVSGALPPLGRPLKDYDLYLDYHILENNEIAFNVARTSLSIILSLEDFLTVTDFSYCSFATLKV